MDKAVKLVDDDKTSKSQFVVAHIGLLHDDKMVKNQFVVVCIRFSDDVLKYLCDNASLNQGESQNASN